MLDPDEDGIYEATLEMTAGNNEEFKFVIANDGNFATLTWEEVDNRQLAVPDEDTVLDIVFFNDVESAGETYPYEILFQVNMEFAILSGTFDPVTDGLVIRGNKPEIGGWAGYDNQLIEIGATEVYAVVVNFAALEVGAELQYKFVIDPDNDQTGEDIWESLDGNRVFVPTGDEPDDGNDGDLDVQMDVVWWSDQTEVSTVPIDVTFLLDGRPAIKRTAEEGNDWLNGQDLEYFIVTGSFDNWGWAFENYVLLDDGVAPDEVAADSFYTVVVNFPAASPLQHVYKYGANGTDNEADFQEDRTMTLDDPNPTQLIEDQFGEQGSWFDDWLSVREVSTPTLPTEFVVEQNYPNPFNPTTTIAFNLPTPGDVTFRVFNVTGQEVIAENLNSMSAGRYELNVDASSFASGIYFYRVEANGMSQTKKMILAK